MSKKFRALNDFEVSIFPFGLSLESEDRSQEAEIVSGPRGMLEKGICEAERIAYTASRPVVAKGLRTLVQAPLLRPFFTAVVPKLVRLASEGLHRLLMEFCI